VNRYYFHIRKDGALVRDEEGLECCDLRAALAEAHASARDIAKTTLYDATGTPMSIEIEDEDGFAMGAVIVMETRH
jgi:hypothetical protein